ncbi:MAG: gamma carbonic anhydrase family protein [Lachnospiraceae bacterium]|nr:gamma carbonic anhydrase family protein [Lachnospiraceae bacterium]MBR4209638.1 gamma carbonic anhydrase family protein [Lachnospiraceae bacterium]
MIIPFQNLYPAMALDVFVAENATIIGDVECRAGSSVWFGAVLRGDSGKITIGENSNVQDNATVHSDEGFEVNIGNHVTIGHNAVVHGCTVGDNTLIGMHATLLNGCRIGKNCLIGAGALIPEGKEIPDGSLVMGIPGKIIGHVSEEQVRNILENAKVYVEHAQAYLKS